MGRVLLRDRVIGWISTTLVAFTVAACVSAGSDPPPIPPNPAERLPAPPPSTVTLIWEPGHFDWDGKNYVLIRGKWVPRGGHGSLWQDGMWRRVGSSWEWVPAHWL